MPRMFDHIDLRVPDLAAVTPFYQKVLPALGFTRQVEVDGWLQYEDEMEIAGGFFGVTASPDHVPNGNRIAFRADSVEAVEQLAEVIVEAGA
ncbi:MAG: glyoxalase, partial [Verrucomicrobiaceae bacterium]